MNVLQITTGHRETLIKLMDRLSVDQMNQINAPFKNNIIWNCAHVIAIQQMLVYGLSGNPTHVDFDFVERFKMGTAPSHELSETEITDIKNLLRESHQKVISDFEEAKFKNFMPYMTKIGVELKTIEDAFVFNSYHEALHLGVILGQMKFLR